MRRLVEVNLLGTTWGTRAAIAAFGSGGGDVVNIASLAGLGPVPGYSMYAATKAAVVSLSTSVNAEAPRGVRVHALCTDGVDTAMLAAQAAGLEQRGPYALRHTFATEALAAGVSTFELARLMGTSVAMIDRTYGHLARDSEDSIRLRLEARADRSGVEVASGGESDASR